MPPPENRETAPTGAGTASKSTAGQRADTQIISGPADLLQQIPTTGVLVAFDWRAAARNTEQTGELELIDHALTATGLAAELAQLADRIGRLT
jgi:hypothetical protein